MIVGERTAAGTVNAGRASRRGFERGSFLDLILATSWEVHGRLTFHAPSFVLKSLVLWRLNRCLRAGLNENFPKP
jgi:hypothetical protein